MTVLLLTSAHAALAQEPGWQFSPLPGEGDRAAMGCSSGATTESFACLVVRCEDDFGVGLYVHTSGPRDDAGRWLLQLDDVPHELVAQRGPAPYNAQVQGDVTALVDELKNAGVAYLERPGVATATRSRFRARSMRSIRRCISVRRR